MAWGCPPARDVRPSGPVPVSGGAATSNHPPVDPTARLGRETNLAYSRGPSDARARLDSLIQVNVAGANHLDPTRIQHQAKRAVMFQSGEAAADRLVLACV